MKPTSPQWPWLPHLSLKLKGVYWSLTGKKSKKRSRWIYIIYCLISFFERPLPASHMKLTCPEAKIMKGIQNKLVWRPVYICVILALTIVLGSWWGFLLFVLLFLCCLQIKKKKILVTSKSKRSVRSFLSANNFKLACPYQLIILKTSTGGS